MKKPNRLVSFLYGLIGRSYVYESADDVREVIATRCFTTNRARTHHRGAQKLTDADAFQPGLIDLHDDLHDAWHYLHALSARADELGTAPLADHLIGAAEGLRSVLGEISGAAEATVPTPAR